MNIDKRFEKLGFIKTKEDKYGVIYSKKVSDLNYHYTHEIEIMHKASGKHLIFSNTEGLNADGCNNVVGLEEQETKLALKKLKVLKRKYKWKESGE